MASFVNFYWANEAKIGKSNFKSMASHWHTSASVLARNSRNWTFTFLFSFNNRPIITKFTEIDFLKNMLSLKSDLFIVSL